MHVYIHPWNHKRLTVQFHAHLPAMPSIDDDGALLVNWLWMTAMKIELSTRADVHRWETSAVLLLHSQPCVGIVVHLRAEMQSRKEKKT